MVLTAAQTTAFFCDGIRWEFHKQRWPNSRLKGSRQSLIRWISRKKHCNKWRTTFGSPEDGYQTPTLLQQQGIQSQHPLFVFDAKSQHRLMVACELVHYYNTIRHDLSAGNMRWSNVMKNFEIQWKALKERKEADDPDVPKICKSLPIMKWTEAFQDYLHRTIGVRTIPLAYITRVTVDVPAITPPQEVNKPHSTEYGSIEVELIARASHDHELYKEDNGSVYYHLEEATRGTIYSASIKPIQRGKNGRGAWLALTSQYAGNNKWEAELKRQDNLLHQCQWKGQNTFPLEGFIGQHRNAFGSMQQCAEHVSYQLPNEHTRWDTF